MSSKKLSKTSNNSCSVPQCKVKEYSSLHKFPKNKQLKKKWIIMCKMGRVTSNSLVCGTHFGAHDFIPALNPKRRVLKPNVFPTINLPVRPLDKILTPLQQSAISRRADRIKMRNATKDSENKENARTCSDQRMDQVEEMSSEVVEEEVTETMHHNLSDCIEDVPEVENSVPLNLQCEDPHCQKINMDEQEMESQDNVEENDETAEIEAAKILLDLKTNVNFLNDVQQTKKEKLTLMKLLVTNDELKIFTGISFQLLDNLVCAVSVCEKKPKQYGLPIQSRIVLCLCKLKLNLSFKCLAVLFNITRQTCSHLFEITLHTLAFILKSAVYWPTKEEVVHNMPRCFKKFVDTYIVLDCTEVPVERANCLRCRLRTYSHYKGCETIKILIGISPSGLIMFVSKCYGGRASDKSIFNQSGVIQKLEPTRDAIMVDKGFSIEEECAENHIKLYVPPKLGKNKQLSTTEVISTVEIAAARVHVERVIQRMKLFNILKTKISLKMAPYMDEVLQIICGIVNLSESIISDNNF